MINPDEYDDERFDYDIYSRATLYVPKGKIDMYRNTSEWSLFEKIEEMEPSSVEKLNENINGNLKVKNTFSIDGKPLSQPQKGMNIQKMSDGTTCKVAVQ